MPPPEDGGLAGPGLRPDRPPGKAARTHEATAIRDHDCQGPDAVTAAGDPGDAALLIVDDEPSVLSLVRQVFADECPVLCARSGAEALEHLGSREVGVVIADQRMPGMTGTELLATVAESWPDIVRITLTAYADVDTMLEAINAGRVDQFVIKPWDNRDLARVGRGAMETYRLRAANRRLFGENARLVAELRTANEQLEGENRRLRREVGDRYALGNMIGDSAAMQAAFHLVEKAAQSMATVLLSGETGTGKELAAAAIHYNGPRRSAKFVAVNCGAMPEGLLESELFGHVKGSFTGALRDRRGLFEEAHGGTILLDEVGEMAPAMQVKVLRVVEDGKVRPVGATRDVQVDVRLIAATNRDLRAEVERGSFRRDLFYRLNVFPIPLPPLRERGGDVRLLADHLLSQCSTRARKQIRGFTPAAVCCLERHTWPGNIRELRNEIERAIALAEPGEAIDIAHLSTGITGEQAIVDSSEPGTGRIGDRMERIEQLLVLQELRRHGNNRTHTAATLGITVRALQKKLARWGLREGDDGGKG
jgi:two-component system, NtrC family, response regulator HupR/HoxA